MMIIKENCIIFSKCNLNNRTEITNGNILVLKRAFDRILICLRVAWTRLHSPNFSSDSLFAIPGFSMNIATRIFLDIATRIFFSILQPNFFDVANFFVFFFGNCDPKCFF